MKRRLFLILMLFGLLCVPVSAQSGEELVYGWSGEGRPLVAWRYGDGENVLVMCFAIHGFEDNWDYDGMALVYSAEKLGAYLENSKLPDLHNWTVYVLPCLNPDGLYSGWTNNGPGRCTTTYFDSSGNLVSGRGIDMNRCFPTWFTPLSSSRNFNANTPMACREAGHCRFLFRRFRAERPICSWMSTAGWSRPSLPRPGSGMRCRIISPPTGSPTTTGETVI